MQADHGFGATDVGHPAIRSIFRHCHHEPSVDKSGDRADPFKGKITTKNTVLGALIQGLMALARLPKIE